MGFYLMIWSGWGFYTDRISLWGHRIQIAELKSGPAWMMAAAFACGAFVLLSAVVDHYDERNNEQAYKAFRWIVIRIGWCLAAASLTAHVYLFFSGAYAPRA
jgi:hypothetical protein